MKIKPRPYLKPGSTAKKIAREADINGLVKREKERHARKTLSLAEQCVAARQIASDGRQRVTLLRIAGEKKEEAFRHKQKMADLTERRRKVWQ